MEWQRPILKERLFGLGNHEGNHGEDVKELYYYLDNLPTHYYMKYLYKYPQAEFPYDDLLQKNQSRGKHDPEYEILDTGIFNEDKYFDVYIEYAKNDSEDIFIKIEIVNRGNEKAPITVLPTLWFYNNWQYAGEDNKPQYQFPQRSIRKSNTSITGRILSYIFNKPMMFFLQKMKPILKDFFNKPNETEFVKDAFHEAIINGTNFQKLKDKKEGTKCAPVYHFELEAKAISKYFSSAYQ